MKKNSKMLAILFAIIISMQLYSQKTNFAVVAADKMNVFYIGIDNPISIAAQGIQNDKLRITITNGTIKNVNGKYTVRVDSGLKTIIYIAAEMKPGEIKMIGADTFIVKKIPNPIACIGDNTNTGINITKEDLLKNPVVNVTINLPFDLKFEVVSYTFTYYSNGDLIEENAIGNNFSQAMLDKIKKSVKGDKIYIENIKAKGPDGEIPLQYVIINIIEKQ